MIPERIKKIDAFLNHLSINLQFSRLNPTNAAEAYRKFRKDKQNPVFTYAPPDEQYNLMQHVIREIRLSGSTVEILMDHKLREFTKKIQLLESVGTPAFTKHSLQLYKEPSPELVAYAYDLLLLPTVSHTKKIKRKQALQMIRGAFKTLGFHWHLKNKEMITSARVNPLLRTLELRKKERFSEEYVKRLIVHELGVHAVRTENGLLQPLNIFAHGLAHYLETEEGLAAYIEESTGLLDNAVLRNYAGRVIAVHLALRYDFVKTYAVLRKYFPDKIAWKLTLRVKRGLTDTSKPGAFTKDALYLSGYVKVKKYMERGGSLEKLFIGKIGIKDIPEIDLIPEMAAPKYLPMVLFEEYKRHSVLTI